MKIERIKKKMKANACEREDGMGWRGFGSECAAYRDVSAQRGVLDGVAQVIHGHGVLKLDVRPIFAS